MKNYIALLRAVNVGGTGKLLMQDLKAICEQEGLFNVQTYIASGNVVFKSKKSEIQIKKALEPSLEKYAGKPVGVLIRTAEEISEILANNPFPNYAPNHTVAIFLDNSPSKDALKDVSGQKDEIIKIGKREIYVYYGDDMGRSKLKIPVAKAGTARNINTITKLAAMSSATI